MALRSIIVNAASILGIGIVCFPVFLILLPALNETRAEARMFVACTEVHYICESLRKEKTSESIALLPVLDPWGKPYRITPLDEKHFRVSSSGPNMTFAATGTDTDDICSDQPFSQFDAIIARKNQQCLIAMGAACGLWVSLAIVYLRWRRNSSS